ncbi:MAG: hypothetical protein IT315_00535 [Anaerolineales bacterium]|nr:hypothetical protein [Anaerolineales bacterium]
MIPKLDRRMILLINIGLALLGVTLDAISFNMSQSFGRFFMESVGIGLVATGFVNFFDKLLVEADKDVEIEIVAMERAKTNQTIHRLKYLHEKVDIMGVSIAAVLREISEDPQNEMVDRILRHSTRLRLICVHPESPFLIQRAHEDHVSWEDLHNRQVLSVEKIVKFYKALLSAYQRETLAGTLRHSAIGSVEVCLTNDCPYLSIYRVDDTIYWGLYTTSKSGHESPLFMSKKLDKDGMFELLKDHIYSLLSNDNKDNFTLIKMAMKDQPPTLNRALAEQILGEDKVRELLG